MKNYYHFQNKINTPQIYRKKWGCSVRIDQPIVRSNNQWYINYIHNIYSYFEIDFFFIAMNQLYMNSKDDQFSIFLPEGGIYGI